MTRSNRAITATCAFLVCIIGAASPSFAQGTGESAEVALTEVIVTARKREESLQDVPISITAFSEETLTQRGVESIYDLALLTPNLSFTQSFGRVFDRPVIRGQSQILGERTVSYVVDGVYIAGALSGADLDDVESVEVLKGPQAANFGRGSLAGVISYRTRKPTSEWRGKVSSSFGDDGYLESSAHVSGPVVGETLTFKLGARYYDYDGQYTGLSSDGRRPRFGAENTERVSGSLRWRPTDDLDFILRAFASQNSDGLYPWVLNPELNCFQTVPGARGGSYCGEQPEFPKDSIRTDLAALEAIGRPGIEADTFLYSAEGSWDVGPVTVTGLVSWNRQDEDWIFDDYIINTLPTTRWVQPGPTLTISNPGSVQRVVQIKEFRSQELRLSSNTDGNFQWLFGLYHYDQDDVGLNASPVYNTLGGMGNTGPVGTLRGYSSLPSEGSIDNQAVFAQVSYALGDRWNFTLEGRYAKDELTRLNRSTTNCPANLEEEFTSFTPRGTVLYSATENVNVYASVAKGNKPGDFNTSLCGAQVSAAEYARLSTITPLGVKEEESLNYELGTKMRLADGRMSIDAAIFFTDWDDQQVTQSQVYTPISPASSPIISLTGNAGQTEVKGIELNWRWIPNENWDFNLGYGYADAEFKELCDNTFAVITGSPVTTDPPCPSVIPPMGAATNFRDASGYQTANAPTHTGSVGAEYSLLFGTDKRFFVRTDYSYQSERFAEVYNHASTGDSTRLDARVGVSSESWDLTVWGRNLGDDRSPSSIRRFINPEVVVNFVPNRAFDMFLPNGRQYGLTATYKF
jgi:outer membrane receptor protein involved in Fe transport